MKERIKMQLAVEINLTESVELPINYNYILQAAIYHNLESSPEYSSFIHNEGFTWGQRQFKMFTFSNISGKYIIKNKKIVFYENIRFEIRSVEAYVIHTLFNEMSKHGIQLCNRQLYGLKLRVLDGTIEEEDVLIKMLSPIVIYSTDTDTGRIYYYHPGEEDFSAQLNDNFCRKYLAYSGVMPDEPVIIVPYEVDEKDKVVTSYKGTYITAWNGIYRMIGKRKYLDFLYQVGIGGKNAQGFGMFELIE